MDNKASLAKTIKSYESAVETLKKKRVDEKRDRKAKEAIFEQYLQQTRSDHAIELQNLQEEIKELQNAALNSQKINKQTEVIIDTEQLDKLKAENAKMQA